MPDITEAKRLLLAEYERERDELDRIIARLRKELGLAPKEASSSSSEPLECRESVANGGNLNVDDLVKPGDFFGQTQIAATRAFLQRRNKQPATLSEIAYALYRGKCTPTLIDGAGLRNLSSVFSRSDELVSVARGRWGLAEWYPERAVAKARKNRAKDSDGEKTETPEAATSGES